MNIDKDTVDKVIHDKGWVGPLVIAGAAFVAYAVLYVFGVAVIGIMEALFVLGGISLLCLAAYRWYKKK